MRPRHRNRTTLLSPLNTAFFLPTPYITTVLVKQFTCALYLLSQSIPRIKSKSYNSKGIRSTCNSIPSTYNTTLLYTSSTFMFSLKGVLIVIPRLSLLGGTFNLLTIRYATKEGLVTQGQIY